MQFVKGMVVRSKAGHDKGSFFVVTAAADGIALLADGKTRTLAAPKRKNLLHLAATKTVLPPDKMTDSEIRSILAVFNGRVRTS